MHRTVHTRGFTLVELLTVVSIIGLLSSVVFASLENSRAQARFAGGKVQDHSMVSGPLAESIDGNWGFDESSGSVLQESAGSGYSQNGSFAAGVARVAGLAIGSGALNFDGVSGFASLGLISDPTIGRPNFTVSLWIKPTLTGAHTTQVLAKRDGPFY